MYIALCIKSYIDEDDLRNFLNGTLQSIDQSSIIKEGKEYCIVREDPEFFEIIND